jgi:competence protein ComEC
MSMSVRLKTLLLVVVLGGFAGFLLPGFFPARGQRLTFLSVGQGDCAVWQDGSQTVLVDVGPKTKQGYDAGDRIVLPKLRRMGVTQVSLILLTHPDADHVGGLSAVYKRFPGAVVAVSSAFRDHPQMKGWLREAGVADVRWIEGRVRVRLGSSTLEIGAPPLEKGANDNDGSLFVRLSCGSSSAVLTGDASLSVENQMQGVLKWKAQVLKAGHHGSRTATSASFVKSVGPRWAVVSCGRENRFGHPHESVLSILRAAGVEVLRTDEMGDVAFEVQGGGFRR